jgi:hypothetical protein
MKKWAHIKDGVVTNVLIGGHDYEPFVNDETHIMIDDDNTMVGIGTKYENGVFINEPPKPSIFLITTVDKVVQCNTDINIKFTIGTIEDIAIDEEWFIPVVRNTDNYQGGFLVIDVKSKEPELVFQIDKPGMYKIKLSEIKSKIEFLSLIDIDIIAK